MNARKCFLVICLTDIEIASDRSTLTTIAQSRSIKLTSTEGKQYTDIFHVKKGAMDDAKRRAALEPTKVFMVMESVGYYETTKPDVLEKTFNDNGEFVLKEAAK